jgi:hypothetical protein
MVLAMDGGRSDESLEGGERLDASPHESSKVARTEDRIE